jgi:hypothetical protein
MRSGHQNSAETCSSHPPDGRIAVRGEQGQRDEACSSQFPWLAHGAQAGAQRVGV